MISCDTSELEAQLNNFCKESTRKMQGMVQKFSYIVSATAIDNTPLGDSIKFEHYYESRYKSIGLEPVEGFAKGSWRVSMDGSVHMQGLYGVNSDEMAESLIRSDLTSYKLGQTVLISNTGPYIGQLENNYTKYNKGQPIVQPTLDAVYRTYQLHLDDYYEKS